jgi:hypothetical protein
LVKSILKKGYIPKTIPILGNMEDTIKNEIPISTPITILLLKLFCLYLPNMNGIAKKSIITVETG